MKIHLSRKLGGFLEEENPPSRKTGWISRGRKIHPVENWVDFSRTENPPSLKLGGFLEIGKSTQSTGWISRGVTFFFPDTPCRKRRTNVADTTFQDKRRRYDMFETQRYANLSQATTRKSNLRRSCARPKSNGPIALKKNPPSLVPPQP